VAKHWSINGKIKRDDVWKSCIPLRREEERTPPLLFLFKYAMYMPEKGEGNYLYFLICYRNWGVDG